MSSIHPSTLPGKNLRNFPLSYSFRLHIGPDTYIKRDEEVIPFAPRDMIRLAPREYCTIKNPVTRDKEGKLVRQ
jgi:hypothetical protein